MATDAEKMMNDYTAAWNSHNKKKILTFFTDDAVYEDVALGQVWRGKKEVEDFINFVFLDFPDFKIEMQSSFKAGDWGADEWIMSGTWVHSSMLGMSANGKSFSARGSSVIEFREGKISRNTDYWNMAAFLQQVGLMPEPQK